MTLTCSSDDEEVVKQREEAQLAAKLAQSGSESDESSDSEKERRKRRRKKGKKAKHKHSKKRYVPLNSGDTSVSFPGSTPQLACNIAPGSHQSVYKCHLPQLGY